jgi:hypothetical protein
MNLTKPNGKRILVRENPPIIHSPRLHERFFHFNKNIVNEGLMAKLRPNDWAIYPVVGIAADYITKICDWGQTKIGDLSGVPQPKVSRSCYNIERIRLFEITRRPHGATRREQTNLIKILDPLPGDFFEFSGALLFDENGVKTWANLTKEAMRVYIVLRAKVHNVSLRYFYDNTNVPLTRLRDDFFENIWYVKNDFEAWFAEAYNSLEGEPTGECPLPEDFLEPFIYLTPEKISRYMELAAIKDEGTFFNGIEVLVQAKLLVYKDEYIFVFPRPLSI